MSIDFELPLRLNKGPLGYHIEGEVAFLHLSSGEETVVDVDVLEDVLKVRWHTVVSKNKSRKVLYVSSKGRRKNGKCGRTIRLHQFIGIVKGYPLDSYEEMDHLNGDGLDNRWQNLKPGTRIENQKNRHVLHSSKFHGVRRNRNSWNLRLVMLGVVYHILNCQSEEEAGSLAKLAYELRDVRELPIEKIRKIVRAKHLGG